MNDICEVVSNGTLVLLVICSQVFFSRDQKESCHVMVVVDRVSSSAM